MADPTRVLFVDDEENIRNVLRRLFRKAPWESTYVASGEEALELFASPRRFDVVVTDQRMPGMSGVDLLKRLRAEHPRVVRMVLSSYTDVETVLGAINDGHVYKFVTKPWRNEVLYQTVADVVEALDLRRENQALQARLKTQTEDISAVDRLVGELEGHPVEPPQAGVAACVLDAAPVALLALREDGTVAAANPEACRILSVADPRAFLGNPVSMEEVLARPGLRGRPGRTSERGGGTVWAFWEE